MFPMRRCGLLPAEKEVTGSNPVGRLRFAVAQFGRALKFPTSNGSRKHF